MAKTQERYEHPSEWLKVPQQAFWKALERVLPSTFGELDAVAKRWAEVAPGADVQGHKFAYSEGYLCTEGITKVMEKAGGGTYIPGGGVLSADFRQLREAWQNSHGLDTSWLGKLADLHILQAHTGVCVATYWGYGVVGDPPPVPFNEVGSTPAEYAERSRAHYRDVVAPHWGLSRVQTIEAPHHLEWLVLYQCCEDASCAAIAERYGQETGNIYEPRTVEKAVKRCAEIIALPLRRPTRGAKAKR